MLKMIKEKPTLKQKLTKNPCTKIFVKFTHWW